MKYLCVHCDHRFEHEGEKKPRCPECMRVNGVEALKEKPASSPSTQKTVWIGALVVVVAAVLAYAWWAETAADTVSDEIPLRPLEQSELRGHLRRLSVQLPDSQADLLNADESLETFATGAGEGAASVRDKARAVTEAIRARAAKQAFVRWSLSRPRNTPVRGASWAHSQISEDEARAELYPLEVALLATVALRTLDVDAMVTEIYAFEGDRSPPDPSGQIGYFGVAVYEGEVGEGSPKVFDPYSGHATEPSGGDHRVLNDVEVVAAALNHLAMHQIVHEGQPRKGFELSKQALALDPRSPTIRTAHGGILQYSGGGEAGHAELVSAAELRRDAPRLDRLARSFLLKADMEQASRAVTEALEMHSDFAGGHATQAELHLLQAELEPTQRETSLELARRELTLAEENDGALPRLPLLWAHLHAADGQMELAGDKALLAIENNPYDLTLRIRAAHLLRMAGRYEDMREQARHALASVPAARREVMRQTLLRTLGPTAFDEPLDEGFEEGEESEDSALADLPSEGFQLGGNSRLLGGGGGGKRPSLLGAGTGRLELGGPSQAGAAGGQQLRLDLND